MTEQEEKLVRKQALEHARALGCNCEPDIEYDIKGGVMHLSIAHDDDCALVKGET